LNGISGSVAAYPERNKSISRPGQSGNDEALPTGTAHLNSETAFAVVGLPEHSHTSVVALELLFVA
jgi:hypothetical protein